MADRMKWKKSLLLAGKIAVGSSLAIYTAGLLRLEFASSAGIVTLLTLATTKKGTLRLSVTRLVTFALVAVLTYVTFIPIHSEWIAYGLFIFLVVLVCEMMDWRAAVSTNAVIGTHFLTTLDFSPGFLLNEFLLVATGIVFASLLNLFHDIRGQKEVFSQNIGEVEERLRTLLEEVANYLAREPAGRNAWKDAAALEERLRELMMDAGEYEGNTFGEDASYYARYFEMRLTQCRILHNLHYEMRKIKEVPAQAEVIVSYIRYMSRYVTERNEPDQQLHYLDQLFLRMKEEPLPASREEFENRAVLYHILMDLEEFLSVKKKFIRREGAVAA